MEQLPQGILNHKPRLIHLIRALPYKYCIYSYEMATSGTVHIQGYVSFQSAKKLAFMKKHLPTAHFDIRRGSHSQAKAYCSKTDDVTFLDGPYEMGDDSTIADHQRQRTDLEEIKQKLDAGATMTTLWEENFKTTARYYRAFEQYSDSMINKEVTFHKLPLLGQL